MLIFFYYYHQLKKVGGYDETPINREGRAREGEGWWAACSLFVSESSEERRALRCAAVCGWSSAARLYEKKRFSQRLFVVEGYLKKATITMVAKPYLKKATYHTKQQRLFVVDHLNKAPELRSSKLQFTGKVLRL